MAVRIGDPGDAGVTQADIDKVIDKVIDGNAADDDAVDPARCSARCLDAVLALRRLLRDSEHGADL